ncbi:MAG: DegT/DnrJ/EryC1/StrS family aminotransferase [Candidatus Aminicenantes bacterium]|nr:DegT/DnrJ/EryC1/StrS family aminotransferase [Candidatus Aminicenantes bacterium]
MSIPFARISLDGNEMRYVREVIESGWLTSAAKVQELERRFARAVGCSHAIAVNSCTSALHLALEALGVEAGDRVLVPTMTFTATAEVIRYMQADPVFLDVEYGTCLLTPDILREAVRRRPQAKTLIVVHYGGQAAGMLAGSGGPGIVAVCRENGIRIIEDAAHAFPAREGDAMVGTLGDIACFSFYANKTITTGEGGMVTTASDDYAARMRVMRLHGIDRDIWSRFTAEKPSWEYDVVAPGFKYNMPDINAAVGLAQLERAEAMRAERQRCARFYLDRLADVPGLDLPRIRARHEDHAWHLFPVVLNERSSISRDRCIERLAEKGIGTSVHYKPLHRMTYYRKTYNLRPGDFPGAEKTWRGCISLPIYPSLKNEELEFVCRSIREIVGT